MKDLCEIIKEIEKETGNPCEIKLKVISEKTKEEIYGNLKERECVVTPAYTGDNKKIVEDIEKLKGDYKNFNAIEKKIRELGFESYLIIKKERKIVEKIERKADKSSKEKTLCGSTYLFGLFELITFKLKNEKEEAEYIKRLKKVFGAEIGIFYDIDKKTKYMIEEFRKHNLPFLNNSYLVQEDGIYLHTADLHPGFMMGVGDKVAKINYSLFEIVTEKAGSGVGGGCCD